MALIEFAFVAISSIVALMEPFSTVAVYVTITKDMTHKKKSRIIARSMGISFVVLAFFALTGHFLFQVFNITIAAFQIAGAILLVIIALEMLNPRRNGSFTTASEDIAVVPLAFPLTAGPGTITAAILLASRAQGALESSFVFVGILIGILISYLGMKYSSRLFKFLGDEGLRVITALMAIIVLAIAVQFVIDGVAGAIGQISSRK